MPLRASERSLRSARRDWERSVRVIVRVAAMRIRGVGRKGCRGDDERKWLKRVGLNSSRGPRRLSPRGHDDTRGSRDLLFGFLFWIVPLRNVVRNGNPVQKRTPHLVYCDIVFYRMAAAARLRRILHASKRWKLRGNVGKGDVNQLECSR